jgi:nucleolar protein 14
MVVMRKSAAWIATSLLLLSISNVVECQAPQQDDRKSSIRGDSVVVSEPAASTIVLYPNHGRPNLPSKVCNDGKPNYGRHTNKPRQPPKKRTKEEEEMNDWNRDIRAMMSKRKREATDRTKPPEEVAKEEAETLHELETRRLARMNGDFEEDYFSDISVDDYKQKKPLHPKSKKNKKKKSNRERNPEELSDSDDNSDDDDQPKSRFTPDGLKYFDKDGNIVEQEKDGDETDSDSDFFSGDDEEDDVIHPLAEGQRVQGNYRSAEQLGGHERWHEGDITKVHTQPDGSFKYDVEYDDRDFEEAMIQENVRPMEKTAEEKAKTAETDLELKFKRNKARDKAR